MQLCPYCHQPVTTTEWTWQCSCPHILHNGCWNEGLALGSQLPHYYGCHGFEVTAPD
jgi:hypothetical protein